MGAKQMGTRKDTCASIIVYVHVAANQNVLMSMFNKDVPRTTLPDRGREAVMLSRS